MSQLAEFSYSKEDLLNDFWGILEQSINKFGSKALVVTKIGCLTFSQAWSTSNVVCHKIKSVINQSKISIGIFARDPRVIIPSMLGVMKSNNHFVILDVTFPQKTIVSMINDAEVKIILASGDYVDTIRNMVDTSVIIIDVTEVNASLNIKTPSVKYCPEDIVQIMYTSGSTGKPKGVIEDYRYLIRSALTRRAAYSIEATDRILRLTSLSNIGSHLDVFISLITGSNIYFHDVKLEGFNNLPGWIRESEITLFAGPPTTFRSFVEVLDPDETFPSIRFFGSGGEKRLPSDMVAVKRHFPNVKQVGLSFGATEVPFAATSTVDIDKAIKYRELPSGIPHPDFKVLIRDSEGNEVPQGMEGEIVVYGNSLARGYLNEPELTKARFIEDTLNPGWQYFRTGDVGRILEDGQLLHLGRMDRMVKIRGVRIELDTIEKTILDFPGITRIAAKVFADDKGMKKIAVYFIAIDNIFIPKSDLRKTLAENLPIQQLPSYLIQVENFPITPSGKIDFERLPTPQMVRPELPNELIPPSSATEIQLTKIWEDCIGVTGIGVSDDFFDIGGDSLLGAIIFESIEESFGVALSLSELLKTSTIRELAKIIDNKNRAEFELPIIPINPTGTKTPLFFIPGKGGYPIRIRHLAKKFDLDTPIYAFQNALIGNEEENLRGVEKVAKKYLAMINQLYPSDSFTLIGESLGGKIAYEVAQQVVAKGKEPPIIFLLDSFNDEIKPEPYRTKGGKSFYRMLVRKHASIWVNSSWEGKKEYLRFYYENFNGKFSRIIKRVSRKVLAIKPTAIPQKYRKIEEEYITATNLYTPKAYPGKVILVKALRGSEKNSPDNGWRKAGISHFNIEKLDCYHGSILFEPAVSELANIINKHI